MARDAADCRDLIATLGLGPVHVVGYSYSAAVALQLAVDDAGSAHSLTLVEPPPVHVPSSAEFRAANARLLETARTRGHHAALEEFLPLVYGPHWHARMEQELPGATEQMQRDAATFFDTDLPALLSWRFDAALAGRVACPVLLVSGSAGGPWFAEVRRLMLTWLSHAEDVVLAGADHSLAVTHADPLAQALVGFLRRHPIRAGGPTGSR